MPGWTWFRAERGPAPRRTRAPETCLRARDNARLVWCHGLRNPFRFHVDAVTGHLHIADVGAALVDEIDECVAGGQNFGWPWLEANLSGLPCAGPMPPTVHPVTVLNHNGVPTAVMSFGRYRNAQGGPYDFGAAYEGDYFYSEYYSGLMRRLALNGIGWIPVPAVAGSPRRTRGASASSPWSTRRPAPTARSIS